MSDNLYQIKRSANTAVPGILAEGELAYSYASNTLFVGGIGGLSVLPIAGGIFTGLLSATPGTTTASKAIITDANNHVSAIRTAAFSVGGSGLAAINITAIANTISANSNHSTLPTAKAVYDYYSSQVSVTALNDLSDVSFSSPSEAQMITFRSGDSQWQNVTVTGDIVLSANGNMQIASGSVVDADVSGSANISRSKLVAGTQNHVVINGSDGRFASEAHLSPSRGGTGGGTTPTENQLLIGTSGGVYATGSLVGVAGRTAVSKVGSNLQVTLPNDVSLTTLTTSSTVAAGSLNVSGTASFSGDVVISGDLAVTGTLTTLNSQNLSVVDPLIELARNNNSDALDIGFFGNYNDGSARFSGLFRDATDGKYRLFRNLTQAPTGTVMTEHASYQTATLIANIESANVAITGGSISGVSIGSLSADLAVADGGTGVSAFTTNGVLFGASGSSLGFVTGVAGRVLQIGTSGVPVFDTLDGGVF